MSWEPETDPLSSDAQEAWWTHLHPNEEHLNTSSDFRLTSGPFMELQRSFWMPKRGKPCLSIQITPETTNNHLPFAYCSFVAHTHENSSQFYLGSIYCNKVCNPLKYKSFPYNPRLYKPRQIFHTFLSHQQEIALTSLTDIRIFRSACHMFTNVSPQELLTLTVSLRRPSLPMLSPPHRRVSSSSSTWILERGKY